MGMLLLFAAAGAFVMSMGLGAICFGIHRHGRRKHGQGSWPLYGLIAVIVTASLIAQGWVLFSVQSQGAPSGEDYNRILKAFILWGSAPGIGLIAGLLAIFKPPASAASPNTRAASLNTDKEPGPQ